VKTGGIVLPSFFRFDLSDLPLHFWYASLQWANEETTETLNNGQEAAEESA
jgi:hypothetical protein